MKIAPAFEALSKQYEGKAKFYKVDADSSKEALALMKVMGVRSVPTFHIWNAGTRIESIQGAHLDEVEYTLKLELSKQNEAK
jgi:thiol-disulfide isomerase/thioredoxin